MLCVKHFISFLLLPLVFTKSQINLHLTNGINENIDDISVQHDCLYVVHSTETSSSSHEISSYCLSESTSTWNIEPNTIDPMFTFADLLKRNITSEQLYQWSAPMDIIEHYQFYLNELSISNRSSLENKLFYNCTLPNFGPQCQYSLSFNTNYDLSLNEIINNYYNESNEPEALTCYTHLQCNRGPNPLCLDWSEICDGKIDCLDNGSDEEHCWLLENNQCKSDEYRCDNGQCIPQIFVHDNFNTFDCLDRSDEYRNLSISFEYKSMSKPIFENEDIICSWRRERMNHFLGNYFTSSCVSQRHSIIEQTIFSHPSSQISNDCLLAFKCHLNIPTSNNPVCSNLCQNETCINIIENMCPDIFFYPTVPIAYGHIYLAYTKQYAMNSTNIMQVPPEYICYNEQLCDGFYSNRTLLSIQDKTCRRLKDFPIYFDMNHNNPYLRFIESLYEQLSHCNRIVEDNLSICNNSMMYQCISSSKCIPISFIGDRIRDCDYSDDEQQIILNEICLKNQSNIFFKCQSENKCIHRNRIEDGNCDCFNNENNLCDDENLELNAMKRHIQFSTMCDSFIDLLPIKINGIDKTDETDCQHWPCNNTYTRCDGIWNCPDGSDEVDCNPSPLMKCPPLHHICVSISNETNQLICLPLQRANDGIVDCLGGLDEPFLCPLTNRYDRYKRFYCPRKDIGACIPLEFTCDNFPDCENREDEQFCGDNLTISTVFKNFFHGYFNNDLQTKTTHLLSNKPKENVIKSYSSLIKQDQQHCHRGIRLRILLDTKRNLTRTTCLCPSNYYGDQCQYQNQRVSLTLQLNTTSDSQSIPFVLVISLIDDSMERIIHSYEQLTYFDIKDQNTKFNIHLLYSNRPKDLSKKYAIHIDIYEKFFLYYRGSFLLPLEFPFLPVERIAVKLNIPHVQNIINTCTDRQCVHGRCIQYLNDPKTTTFCQCHAGWSGQYCTIPNTCTCSPDSLCVDVAANNRSICVCPIDKFGSKCLLTNNVCQSGSNNLCLNGGMCIPSDQYTASRYPFVCICPKGFAGDRCEIPDTKIILSFHKDIILPVRTLIFFHLIDSTKNTLPIHNITPKIICGNETSVISYSSHSFNMVFIQLSTFQYYFIFHQNFVNQSLIIERTINPLDHCLSINELFHSTVIDMHPIQRMKYYHLPCQNPSLNLSCFYDDAYMCLCHDYGNGRLANCFEFNHNLKIDDLNTYPQKIERECWEDYSFNSSTSSIPSIPSTSSTSSLPSTSLTQTTTNDMSSIHASQYFLCLFILLFCFI